MAFHTLGNKLFPKPKKPALKPHLPWIKKLCESGGIIQIPSPEKIEALLIPESVVLLAGLKQKSSPNKAQTLFISHKYVAIMIEPLNKTERYSCTKSL